MLKGVFTAIITPFNKDGSIDKISYRELLENQVKNGIHGLVPVGTTGESPTLSKNEKEFLIETAVDVASGRVPVIAGTGSNSTQAAIDATKTAKELGADYTLQVAPYYNKPSEDGLYRHFSEIADKAGLPVILYNVPGRSGINLPVSLILKLAENSMIVAVKEASGNMGQILELLIKRKDGFSVLSGDDALTLPLMAAGGDGVISVASNAFPKEMVQLVEYMINENLSEAQKIHNIYINFFSNLFIAPNPVPIKTYLSKKGIIEEVFRLPLCGMQESQKEILFSSFN